MENISQSANWTLSLKFGQTRGLPEFTLSFKFTFSSKF